MNTEKLNKSIKNWAEDDRPREKLVAKGKESLSNSELLAILLGSGSRSESAVDVAKKILESCNHNLADLSKLGLDKLKKFKGVGTVKAINIEAALELGRRRQREDSQDIPSLNSSHLMYSYIKTFLEDLNHEEFWLIVLNRALKPIYSVALHKGGINSVSVDPKIIFKTILEYNGSAFVICHNHPSGSMQPSQFDLDLTSRVKKIADFMDIKLVDHLIICPHSYYSFADEGKL